MSREYGTSFPYAQASPMGLLDKLKPQPRWKHADPTVRLEAVRELEDAAELAGLAEGDPDARVRRAAIGRIADPEVLGAAGGHRRRRRGEGPGSRPAPGLSMAGPDEATALAATQALADPRRLSALARSDAPEAVRTAALPRERPIPRARQHRASREARGHGDRRARARDRRRRGAGHRAQRRAQGRRDSRVRSRHRRVEETGSRRCSSRSKPAPSRRPSASGPKP